MRRQATGAAPGAHHHHDEELGGKANQPEHYTRSAHTKAGVAGGRRQATRWQWRAAFAILSSAVVIVLLFQVLHALRETKRAFIERSRMLRRNAETRQSVANVEPLRQVMQSTMLSTSTSSAAKRRRRNRVPSLVNATIDSFAIDTLSSSMDQPVPNLWDDEDTEEGSGSFASFLEATTRRERESALNATVHAEGCRYCDFQRLDAATLDSPEGLERLRRVRLDRPVILYNAMPRLRNWGPAIFLSDKYANTNVTMQTNARRWEEKLGTLVNGPFGAESSRMEARRISLHEFVRGCVDGRLRESLVFQGLFGARETMYGDVEAVDPWFDEYLKDIAAPNVEDILFKGDLGLEYFVGPWRSQLERTKEAHEAVLRSTDRFATMTSQLDSDVDAYKHLVEDWGAWVQGDISNDAFANRIRASEFASAPLMFLGPHLMGSLAHVHEKAVQTTVHGYRIWFVYSEAEKTNIGLDPAGGVPDIDTEEAKSNSFSFTLKYVNKALYRRTRSRKARRRSVGFCCQPPGSIVFLPRNWRHTVFGWGEDKETGDPVPMDSSEGGITVSVSHQAYGKVGFFYLKDNSS